MFSITGIDEQTPKQNHVVCLSTPAWRWFGHPHKAELYKVSAIYFRAYDAFPYLVLEGIGGVHEARFFRDVDWSFGTKVCKRIEQQMEDDGV